MSGAGLVVLAVVAAGVGYGLAWLSGFFGNLAPAVMLGIPLVPLAGVAAFSLPWVGVALVFLSIPVGDSSVPLLPLELVQLLMVAVVALVVLRRAGEGTSLLPWSAPLWWFLALAAWSLVALPSAPDSALAVRQTALVAGELAFVCTVMAVCATPRHVRLLMGVLTVVGVVVAITAFGGTGEVKAGYGGAYVAGRAQGVFNQPNQLGAFCAAGLLVAVGLVMGARSRTGRWLAGGAATLITMGLLMSLSRGAWIGVALALAVLLVMLPEARRALVGVGVPLLVLAVTIGAFAPSSPQVRVVGERASSIVGQRNPYDDRPAIWEEARRQVRADPLTGQGPGSFPVVSGQATSETGTAFADHAHNILLTVAAETGLPAAAFFVGLVVHVGAVARRAARRA
ncbi:MAG: O-antigen ligase family protein, partial [Actinomycetota bacterium]|nr:O-antigen ligase family protein [Actinomycetota bacterium]